MSAKHKGKSASKYAKLSMESKNILDVLNQIADEVNSTLEQRYREKYFSCIVLLYSLIENLLKWLIFAKVTWDRSVSPPLIEKAEVKMIERFARDLSFYSALRAAYAVRLIDFQLFERLDQVRQQRNDIIHQYWLYSDRENSLVLKRELETLAAATDRLTKVFKKLVKKIGADVIVNIFL